ncbi:hypothetical protein HK099_001034 [Clydaea vesicula]|uniref:Dipeptidase n=1 Tax=Clydaea vesicula TaxID=447962 RepID=A0AAD5U5G8_9FUNG|nr:hypothetical protein HK099_001034 [Clydaea vesicula]
MIFISSIIVVSAALCQISSAPANSPLLSGFADLHVHQMAEFAFRRAWFAKGANGGYSHKGKIEDALHQCNGGFNEQHAGTIFGPLIDKEIGPDAGLHLEKRWGVPDNDCDRGKPNWYQKLLGLCKVDKNLSGFPIYTTYTHQQVWEGYLKTAHDSGLTLMVMSAVNYKPLCKIMATSGIDNDPTLACDGMVSIKRQFDEAKIFCTERKWCQVVYSPEDARNVIAAGRMAVLLSIELSHIFEDSHDAIGAQVDYWYDQGMRVVQIAHEEDNIFAGVNPTNPIFKFFQAVEAITHINPSKWPEVGEDGLNKKGLTEKGVALVNKLMEKGIIIDVAHLSFRSTEDIFQIGVEKSYYPFIQSHGSFGHNDYSEERYLTDWMSLYLKKSGGMLGSMTRNVIKNYEYSFQLGINIAFGSDLNGFAKQLAPNATFQDKELREKGFAHMGLYPGLKKEIEYVSLDKGGSILHRSTENVVQLWERCLNNKRKMLSTEGFNPSNKFSASPRGVFNASQV